MDSEGLAFLLATAGEVVVVRDADLEPIWVSPNVEAVIGFDAETFVASWHEIVHPDDARRVRTALADVAAEPGGRRELRARIRHADGRIRTFDISFANHLDEPAIGGVVARSRDVTDQAAAEHRMQRLLRDSSGTAYVLDVDGRVTWTTPGFERFIGHHREMTREVVAELFSPHDDTDIVERFLGVVADGPGATARLVGRLGPRDAKRWVDVALTNALDDPAINGVIVNVRDVDEAVRAGETGHRLAEVLESTTDLVCVFDRTFDLVWANAAAIEIVGSESAGRQLRRRLTGWTRTVIEREVIPTLETRGTWRGELALLSKEDVEIPIEVTVLTHRGTGGEIEFVSAIARDISHRKALESQLRAKARHDPLTALPNRSMLSERLELALADGVPLAVLFLDLDHFKVVNDTQGHDAGDQLLVAAAERIRRSLRPGDLVARFGGDEFVVLLPGVGEPDQARALAVRVLDHLRGPIQIGPIEVVLSASAGVALSSGSDDATTLVSNADAAMYEAKANGRDQVATYTERLRARTIERLETAKDLRSALDGDELQVWYQPIIDAVSGLPIALEALARWIRPDGTLVPTDHFVQVAEDTGLILPLGAAVIRRVCETISTLGPEAEPFSFSVNLSAHQLADPALIGILRHAIDDHGIRPRQLYCEVTESAVMGDVATSAEVLDHIRALGVGIAMDDFGTGYSSLAYLHRFPVDVLKIDREFVHGLTFDGEWDRSLAAGIISLGHSLGLTVVAEGVETQEQADILGMLDCDAMQGFLFAQPAPIEEVLDLRGVATQDRDRRSAAR